MGMFLSVIFQTQRRFLDSSTFLNLLNKRNAAFIKTKVDERMNDNECARKE